MKNDFLKQKLTLKDSNIPYQFYIKSPFFSKMSITTVIIIITRKKVLKVTLFSNSCLYTLEFTDIQKIVIYSWQTQLVRPCMYCITELYFKINNSIIINALKQNNYALPSYFIVEPEFGRYSKGWK